MTAENVSRYICEEYKHECVCKVSSLHIKKLLGIFRELITATTTTTNRSQSGFLGRAFQVQK